MVARVTSAGGIVMTQKTKSVLAPGANFPPWRGYPGDDEREKDTSDVC